MDPEQIREALQTVQQLRADGKSDREIDSLLRRSKLPVNSLLQLDTEARAQIGQGLGKPQEQSDGDRSTADRVRQGLAALSQGTTGSFASDLIGQLEKIGLAREGASERFRQDVETSREEDPILSTGLQIAGLLGGPAGRLGARAVGGAARAAGAIGGRAGAGAARVLGGGELTQLAGSGAGRSAAATVGGGAAGALEGGLLGFGEAAGQPTEERLEEAVGPALIGGAVAAPIAGVSTAVQSARRVGQLSKQRGEVLAEAGERVGRDLPTGRKLRERVRATEKRVSEQFGRAEAAGQDIPGEVTELLSSKNPQIRKALRNAANQGSPEAKRFLRGIEAFEAGEAGSIPAASFQLADDVRKQLRFRGDAFARRGTDAVSEAPSAGAVEEAQRVQGLLEETLEGTPGFVRALEEAASAGGQRRAFQQGRQLFSKTADEFEEVIEQGKKVQSGGTDFLIGSSQEAREAARSGAAINVVQKLRGGSDAAENFLTKLDESSELRRKMKVILGGDDALQEFMAEASRLRAIGQADKVVKTLIKAAGFLGAGTSLFGGALVEAVAN